VNLPLTKSARRRWLAGLPKDDQKREQRIANENAERIRQAQKGAQK
jgi:hypothetical protein